MKILMLSWEYPPKNIGGISNHVYFLSKSLKNLGHEVHVITCIEGDASIYEDDNGVFVHRVVPYSIDTEDFTKWVMHLNFAMAEEAVRLINNTGKFHIIHVHDWLALYSAKLLKWSYNIPVVCTMHATEHGRNGGIRTDMQRYISSAEWMLTYESWKVITCSEFMKDEVKNIFNIPDDKFSVIPNGISLENFNIDFDSIEFRRKYALDEEKIIFYIGRHVYEKGIQLLIEAAPDIINSYKDVKFIIAGKGPMTDELMERTKQLGLQSKVIFTGYMDEEQKRKMYKVSDLAVFPSIYEPFGIVALEAMAAGCPVVVSEVGGLKEIIEHKVNGIKVLNGSKDSLKENIIDVLKDEELRKVISKNGYNLAAEKYTWDKIAQSTVNLYEKVKNEAKNSEWEIKEEKPKKKRAGSTKKKKGEEEEKSKVKNDKLKEKDEKETKVKRTRKKQII
ncbi:glycosyltransferase family 4 protein [Clostridium sp. SYSU_GA19001]|uniref:glycosyltransferase family 4 protein n=1 Tax=Clostridium caldaquaticum TaxID=2940653 RepID=UPI0020776F15|nr:glycosyltransferase family 4 protein [Clostridium caldaquaticum]MCM8711140.1 glycosyltransferase family 4 protein [Clostridium caldaquaticum]